MICSKCGAQLMEGDKFCTSCGTPVKMTPNVKKVPEYKDVNTGSKGTKVLLLVAILAVILAVAGVLGFIFLPQIKDSVAGTESFEGFYKKAEAAMDKGDYEAAIGYYQKIIDKDPEEADAYIGMATAYRETGNMDKALDILAEGYMATGYDPDDPDSKGSKSILKRLKEYAEEEGVNLEDLGILVSEDKDTDEEESETEEDEEEEAAYTGEKTDININVRQVDNSNFPNVTVYVSITDDEGNSVENLTKSDFNITEIDKDGNVSGATIDDVYRVVGEDKINVNLVLDRSGSMSGTKMTQAKNAANALIDYMTLESGDRAEIISFDDYVYLEQDFTSQEDKLVTAVDNINPGGSTALFDAIYAGVYQTYYENGAKCVIAFTDGEENASSYTFDDVVDIAQNTGIPVYIIGIGDYSYDSTILKDLAAQCSGSYYSADESDLQQVLEEIYIGIYREQQDSYVFKYTASNLNDVGEFRDLVIETSESAAFEGRYVKSYVPQSDIAGAFSSDYADLDFILDFTSTREVTDADLAGLSLAELRIARNEIFARHGRQFKDPLLNQWFYSKDWYLKLPMKYAPDVFDKNNPDPLSSIEQANTNFILNYEKNLMNTNDIYPHAATEPLTEYDLALSKPVLKTALEQMNRYSSTATLEENKRLVQEAIDNPDVEY